MKFFIIGDSWGKGEWGRVNGSELSAVPDTGLDFYLGQLGHTITNVSAGGACNFGQLRNAYWTLRDSRDYDFIVWFHTEPVRDVVEHVLHDTIDGPKQYSEFAKIKDFNLAMQYINERNYQYAQEVIYQEFQIPFIVIGGVGRLEDSIDDYEFAKYKIHSWPEEILDLTYRLPRNCLIWNRWPEMFDNFSYDKSQLLNEFEATDNYQTLMKKVHCFRTTYM